MIVPKPAVSARLLPPLTVLKIRILPAPGPVFMDELPVKVIAFINEMFALVLVIDPLKLTEPPPL
jgi:hypothetical protein